MFPTEAQRHRECEGGKVREDDVRRITGDIIDSAMKIHKMFGPGLLESVDMLWNARNPSLCI